MECNVNDVALRCIGAVAALVRSKAAVRRRRTGWQRVGGLDVWMIGRM